MTLARPSFSCNGETVVAHSHHEHLKRASSPITNNLLLSLWSELSGRIRSDAEVSDGAVIPNEDMKSSKHTNTASSVSSELNADLPASLQDHVSNHIHRRNRILNESLNNLFAQELHFDHNFMININK